MTSWICWLPALLGAGFIGWGLNGVILRTLLDARAREIQSLSGQLALVNSRPPETTIVERFVDRLVDNPEQRARIAELEGEVAVIETLRDQIVQLQTAPPRIIEKFVEQRVEVPVEKLVEVPIERIIEKPIERLVDNPAHLARIKTLEEEVAVMAGLRNEIAQLRAQPPQIVERIIEKPVEVPVEKLVEKRIEVPVEIIVEKPVERLVDNPAHLTRIHALEREVAVIKGLREQITLLQSTPPQIVEKIVERRVEVPIERLVEVPVEAIVEKSVERLVDNPIHLARIQELEAKVAVIAGLRDEIAQLRVQPPKIVEMRVEVPIEKIVEKRVEVPVEKVVDRLVDNPTHLARIAQLEQEVAVIAGLQDRIAQLEAAPPKIVEKIVVRRVKVPIEKIVEKRVEVPVEKIVVRRVTVPAEPMVQTQVTMPVKKGVAKTVNAPADKIAETHVTQEASPSRTTSRHPAPAKKVTRSISRQRRPDDLKRICGIGPVLERFLHKRGVFWFRQVAKWNQADIGKLEKQLPSFVGRITRENWVRSAIEEHYKKYKQWLGSGRPPLKIPETR